MEQIEEKPISMAELAEEVEKIKKRDKEPNIRVTKTEEYLQSVLQLKRTKQKELEEKIEKLNIPRLKPEHIKKITDIMPKTEEELKVILQGYTITVTKENMKKIVEAANSAKSK